MERLIPFSPDVYVGMFARYNADTWPALVVALLLGGVAVICIRRREPRAGRILALSAATFWIWAGLAFHIGQYANLNWAAYPFGALFIAQGALTLMLSGRFGDFGGAAAGIYALLAVAALGHPTLTLVLGYPIETAHGFGTAPATVALVAVAALFATDSRAALWLLVWPVLWSAWDLAMAWEMEIWRDTVLPALTLAAALFLITRRLRRT